MTAQASWDLARYRSLLRLQVRQLQLHPRLQSRLDDSDLVHETLLKAHENLGQFRGTSEGELVRWLQRILRHVVYEQVDRMRAAKRDVAREQSLQAALAESSVRLEAFLAAEQSSPSELAERKELLLRLSEAIDHLPEEQRDAIIHHHLLGTPVAEIARLMGKTDKAVAMMLYHGKRRLRDLL